MNRSRTVVAGVAFLIFALAPLMASAQTFEFQKEIAAGSTENTQDISLKIAGTVGNPTQTFVSVLPIQNAPPLPPPTASYDVSLNGSAFVAVGAAFVAVGAGATGGQVRFDPATPASGGRVTIQVTHNAAIVGVGVQTLTLKVKIPAAVASTTCFFGVATHGTAGPTLVAKFSVRTPDGFFSDNYCNSVTGNPALSAATMAFTNATVAADKKLSVTVINTGTGDLTLGAPSSAAPFAPTPPAAGALVPNGAKDIEVTYHPTIPTPPTQTGTLTVPSVAGPPSFGVALSGTAFFRELVLCLDLSNSMNWDVNGVPLASCPVNTTAAVNYGTDARIRKAQDALTTLNSRLDFYGNQQVQWAIVQFPGSDLACGSSQADAAASPSSTWSNVVRPLGQYNNTAVPSPLTQITGATTFGYYHGTPMKQGLIASLGQFSTTTGQFRAILLLSDGAHNIPPAESPNDEIVAINANNARVYAVGFGTTGDVDMPLLMGLASGTSGLFFNATAGTGDAADLPTFYNKIFTTYMGLQTAIDPRAQVASGAKNSHKALVTEYDRKLTFMTTWKTQGVGRLQLELVTPGGERITPKTPWIKFFEGPTHQMYGIEVPEREAERRRALVGEWTLEVSNPAPAAGTPVPAPESYSYDTAMASDLEMQIGFNQASYQTGDRVVLTARLSEVGVPMLQKNVRLRLQRPDEGLGKWYAAHAVPLAQIESGVAPVFGAGSSARIEAISGVLKKHYYLTQIQKVAVPGMKVVSPPPGIELHDDGKHGDLRANDGIYTVVLENMLEKTGTYRFMVEADGDTRHQNKFRRETEKQYYVTPRIEIDPKFTRLVLQKVEGGEKSFRRFKATVTPQDRFGNLLGPGFDRAIRLESSSGRALTKDVEDDLNGNYSRVFEYDSRAAAPVVRGSVQGLPLEEDNFREDGGSSAEDACAPCRLLYVVLVLLALAVVLAVVKLKKP